MYVLWWSIARAYIRYRSISANRNHQISVMAAPSPCTRPAPALRRHTRAGAKTRGAPRVMMIHVTLAACVAALMFGADLAYAQSCVYSAEEAATNYGAQGSISIEAESSGNV